MSSPYDLRLMTVHTSPGYAPLLPERPPEVPETFDNAGLLINHSLLAAEILGLDFGELMWRLEAVWAVPAEVLRAFDEEDAQVMDELFGRIEAALGEALDEEGAPRGEGGSLLAASPRLGRDREGRLYFHSHRLEARDLQQALGPFRRFLRFAAEHGLWLRVE
jgi:hypothetical protein